MGARAGTRSCPLTPFARPVCALDTAAGAARCVDQATLAAVCQHFLPEASRFRACRYTASCLRGWVCGQAFSRTVVA